MLEHIEWEFVMCYDALYMLFKKKRQYTEKLEARLKKYDTILLRHLRDEWDAACAAERRAKRMNVLKGAGLAAAKALIGLAAVGGALTVAAIAPNVFAAYGRTARRRVVFDRRQLQASRKYLQQRRYFEFRPLGNDRFRVTLTDKGRARALEMAFATFRAPKPETWDGRWRIVLSDIPDKHKSERDTFRKKLLEWGFYPFQESACIYPYECREAVVFLMSVLGISTYTQYLEVVYVLDDADFRNHFHLR